MKIKRLLMVFVALLSVGYCLADGETLTKPTSEAPNGTYVRPKGKGNWGTLCLPYQIVGISGVSLYVPYYCSDEIIYVKGVTPSNTTPISAGSPVMFQYQNGATCLSATITGAERTEDTSKDEVKNGVYANCMYGNLYAEAISVPQKSSNYILAWTTNPGKDEIRKVTTGSVTIPKYRAYFNFANIPTSKPSGVHEEILSWELDGGIIDDPSGIDHTPAINKDEEMPIYDLTGRRVSSSYRGIVISKGRKIIQDNN